MAPMPRRLCSRWASANPRSLNVVWRLGARGPASIGGLVPSARFVQISATKSRAHPTLSAQILRRPALGERGEALIPVLAEQRDLVAFALDREAVLERSA